MNPAAELSFRYAAARYGLKLDKRRQISGLASAVSQRLSKNASDSFVDREAALKGEYRGHLVECVGARGTSLRMGYVQREMLRRGEQLI